MAPRSRFIAPLANSFDVVVAGLQAFHFAAIHMTGIERARFPADTPALLIANHVSWWDGFLLRAVQRRLRPRSALLTVVSDDTIERFPVFAWMGAVGVRPGSTSSVRAMLHSLRRWRASRGAGLVVAYFPQGRIWPSSRRPLGFRRGVAAVAAALHPVAIVPVALHIEPLTTARPHAFIRVGPALVTRDPRVDVARLESSVVRELDALRSLLDDVGEAALAL